MLKVSQTDGLVLRKAHWDQLILFVLFSIREVPQASIGFSSFELLYGRRAPGMLDLAKDAWEQQLCPHQSVTE
jgi:hypothetical protein